MALKLLIIVIIALLVLFLATRGKKTGVSPEDLLSCLGALRALRTDISAGGLTPDLQRRLLEILRRCWPILSEGDYGATNEGALLELIDAITAAVESASLDELSDEERQELAEFMRKLRALRATLVRDRTLTGLVAKGKGHLAGGAPDGEDAERTRDEETRAALGLAKGLEDQDMALDPLENEVTDFLEAWGGRPVGFSITGTDCGDEQPLTNVAYGNGTPIKLHPGCCLELVLSPKLKDTWGNDLEVGLASGTQGDISVEGLPHYGSPSSEWTPLSPEGSGRWEVKGVGHSFRKLRICNKSSGDVEIREVKRL